MCRRLESYLPLYITHENCNKVKDMFQGISRSLQNVISKTPQEDEEVTQIISKEFCQKKPCKLALLGKFLQFLFFILPCKITPKCFKW